MPPEDDRRHAEREMFGGNLRAVRERRGMGQRELAERMAAQAFPWHQNTVTRVETGARELTFSEILALGKILGVSPDRFTWESAESLELYEAADTRTRLGEAWQLTSTAILRLHAARLAAQKQLAQAQGSKYERVRNAAEDLAETLGQTTLEYAAGDAVARFEHPDEEEES